MVPSDDPDEELPVPVAGVHLVDPPGGVHEGRAVGERHEPGQPGEEIAAVHEEVQGEREDHEDREAGAREPADEVQDLSARFEELRRSLGGVARGLDRLVGVQRIGGACRLQLVDVARNGRLQALGGVDDGGDERDREEEDDAGDDEEGESRRPAPAEASAREDPDERLDREGEEAGGDEPDDRFAHEPDADEERGDGKDDRHRHQRGNGDEAAVRPPVRDVESRADRGHS